MLGIYKIKRKFENELKIAADIKHQNILKINHIVESNGSSTSFTMPMMWSGNLELDMNI